MGDFTYESKDTKRSLETYEWDRVWLEHAPDSNKPRVLYVGDSISAATWRVATAEAKEEIYFDGFATSKALDNPYFIEALSLFARQEGYRSAVLFNNGLHGWHLTEEEYAEYYERMLGKFKELFGDTPIVLLLTTHIVDAERNERVKARNEIVLEIAKKYSLKVVDYYSLTTDESLISADGVHLTETGYKGLAKAALAAAREYI